MVYELKAKDFCVFDFVELLFFNGVLQNNYFKKHFAINKVKVHVFEVPLSFDVFDYYRKICKRKQTAFTVAINKI